MNSLNNVGFSIGNSNHIQQEDLINTKLPNDILHKIFGFLEKSSIQQANLVTHFWNDRTIEATKCKEFADIKKIVDFLQKEFFFKETKESFSVLIPYEILGSKNLLQIQASVKNCIRNILNKLKLLTFEQLTQLENSYENDTFFVENFSKFTAIYKEIANASKLPVGDIYRDSLFSEASKKFIDLDELDKAVEIANEITSKLMRDTVFPNICEGFVKKNLVAEALVFASTKSEDLKGFCLERIFSTLIIMGKKDEGIKIADTMSGSSQKVCFESMCRALVTVKKTNEAIDLANTLPLVLKVDCLDLICETLLSQRQMKTAIELARMIPYTTESICKMLAKNGFFREAKKFSQEIEDPTVKKNVDAYIKDRNYSLYDW